MAAAVARGLRDCGRCVSRHTCTAVAHQTHAAPPHEPDRSAFRRPLPASLVAFSSTEGRRLFSEAMRDGHLEAYFPLSEQFVTQSEPMFCGLGTLTMVMNALGVDPRRRWRDTEGPGWRWWADEMFPTPCSGSLSALRADGVTMEDFELLASAAGASVRMVRAAEEGVTVDDFRQQVATASRMEEDSFHVQSFCRASLGQTGGGHFSPIGGYHAATDSALVMDVARFKYPPYWVPIPDLYAASGAVDDETGRSRGWFTLGASADETSPLPPGSPGA